MEAAIAFIDAVGSGAIRGHEDALIHRALLQLSGIGGVRRLGSANVSERVPLFAFSLDRLPPAGLVAALDAKRIGIRGGELSALPLLRKLGLDDAARASFYFYNTLGEVDRFADALDSEATRARVTA
jgi:cysteine desulfurase/selenocysteine lyase